MDQLWGGDDVEPTTIDEMLARARARLDRVRVDDVAAEIAAGAIVVDTRPEANRREEGMMPAAIVVERNLLEWRLSPSSEHRLEGITVDSRVILVCNDGYASSLAAVILHELGLPRATDLDGGYRAWKRRAEI